MVRGGAMLGLSLVIGTALGLLVVAGSAAACHPANDLVGFRFYKDLNNNPAALDRCLPFEHSGWDPNDDIPGPNYIETLGGGVCAADVDKDGKVDLYLTNGRESGANPTSQLFRNTGNADHPLRFEDITASAGVGLSAWSTGCAFADYDNDGDPDLYVAGYGRGVLYRNKGSATFEDVTAASGVANDGCAIGTNKCWGSSPAWLDYDRDGDLDLFIANYIDGTDQEFTQGSLNPANHDGQPNALYRNDGPNSEGVWRFTEVSDPDEISPVGVEYNRPEGYGGKSLGVAIADYNGDGWPDILVANDEDYAALYKNNQDGTFTDISKSLGLNDPRANMGVDWADVTGDGRLDNILTHFSDEDPGLWKYTGSAFEDIADSMGLGEPWNPGNPQPISWGTNFFDLDNDGDYDTWITNGNPSADDNNAPQEGLLFEFKDGTFAWLNDGSEGDAGSAQKRTGRGAVFSDLDNDGDVDIVAANNKGRANLLRNAIRGDGSVNSAHLDNHWLSLSFKGKTSPCEPWGATVKASFGGKHLMRALGSGGSYQSSNEPRLHFGLGSATSATVEVTWPSGATQTATYGASAIDKAHTLTETHDAAPPAPTQVEVTGVEGTTVDVRFTPVGVCDFERYEFHVGTTADFTPSTSSKVGESSTRDRGTANFTVQEESATLYLRVLTVDPAGQRSAASPAVEFHTGNLPPPALGPPSVDVTGPTTANVAWSQSSADDFASYEVHASPDADFTPSAASHVATFTDRATTSGVVEGLRDHSTLHLCVVVVDQGGLSSASPSVTLTTPNGPPPAPDLEAPPAGLGEFHVTLAWPTTPPPHDLASYQVHMSDEAGFEPTEETLHETFTEAVTERVVRDLRPGQTYHFRLAVVDTGDPALDALSDEVSATTQAVAVPAVALAPAAALGHDWASLQWNRSEADVFEAYEIHLSAQGNFTPTSGTLRMTIAAVATTEANVTGLNASKAYHARVVVRTEYGSSASNEVAFTTPAAPAAVAQPSGNATGNSTGNGSGTGGSGTGGTGTGGGGKGSGTSTAHAGFSLTIGHLSVAPSADGTSAVVRWETNLRAYGTLYLDDEPQVGDGGLATVHTATLQGLAPGRSYEVRVVAREPAGPTAEATKAFQMPSPGAGGDPPAAPEVRGASLTADGVMLRWQWPGGAAPQDVERVRVYRSADNGQEELMAELPRTTTSFLDPHPEGGLLVYRVAAVDGAGRASMASPASTASVDAAGSAAQRLDGTQALVVPGGRGDGDRPLEGALFLGLGVGVVGLGAYGLAMGRGAGANAPLRRPPRGSGGAPP